MKEKVLETNISAKMKAEFRKQTIELMTSIKSCGDKLTEEVVSMAKSLADSYKGAADKEKQEFKSAFNNFLEALTNAENTILKSSDQK